MPNSKNLQSFIHDDKFAIIEHINEEHDAELQAFAKYLLDLTDDEQQTLVATKLLEIYQQGIELELKFADKSIQRFLAFYTPITQLDDLNQAYIQLLQASETKQGKKTIQLVEQNFKVIDSYFVTQNMFRLVLQMPNDTPLTHAGYAYLFNIDEANTEKNRNYRYYTLRKAFIQNQQTIGWVDIFIHDNNGGGTWAQSLKKGDIISSKREFPENIEHLQQGQVLLMADETSLPTVARLLELWQNPITPIIITVTQNSSKQHYLQSVIDTYFSQSNSPKVIHLLAESQCDDSLDDRIIKAVQNLKDQNIKLDKIWGGLEATLTKSLRNKLLSMLDLTREQGVMKVYWRK
ncbi:SIP domain-containing protein (plasmid) [Moraxella atlantae]|uniref:SIP domain-containing protein n=1 Tax=Faucicola atlantae TaxID=34059 RepID=UPI0037518138